MEEDEIVGFDNDKYCILSDDSGEIQLIVVEQKPPVHESDKKAWYPIGKLKIKAKSLYFASKFCQDRFL